MKLSTFGQKITSNSGINLLMDDLGRALSEKGMLMLGGGNPAHIPEVQQCIRGAMQRILERDGAFERAIGDYDSPQGNPAFIESLAALLHRECGWDVGPRNIALTTGSQGAFFILFNMFAGRYGDGSFKKILLPLAPEYIGYSDVGLEPGIFRAVQPEIEYIDDLLFKYHVDFQRLEAVDDAGAICFSRPTNPTGNMMSDEETQRLMRLAEERDVPLIIDGAYGLPFPGIVFSDAAPQWSPRTILCMSLSKFGLPALRTGIVVASEEIIAAISAASAIMCLAPNRIGATLANELIREDKLLSLGRDVIRPYYQSRADRAVEQLRRELRGIDCRVHKPEGAFFLWLWFRDLPISSQEFYERLKARGVLVVPGRHFFPGLEGEWKQRDECLRISYAQNEATVQRGLSIIADEARKIYSQYER
ncbi:valine--pyruvate transaminase [Candidatus Sumerlaeota bacterium]|nr:valine--pyruvate transaminase [Candidatus Sumerlaeota bacterium]